MSLDDSIHNDDEQLVFGDLTVLMEKRFYQSMGDKLKVDFVEGQGIVVERMDG